MTPPTNSAQKPLRTQKRRSRGRNSDWAVRERIRYLAFEKGLSGAAIARSLEQDPEFAGRALSERTVQAIIKAVKPRDPSGPWRLMPPAETAAIDAQATLAVLGWLVEWTSGYVLTITNRQARWVTEITRAAPSIPPAWAYDLAVRYILAEDANRATEYLDRVLALRVWEDETRYHDAVASGFIPELPSHHFRMPSDANSLSVALRAKRERAEAAVGELEEVLELR